MSKVTSKLQVTIPKAIADQYGIKPGDEIEFRPAGEAISVIPPRGRRSVRLSLEERRRLFDEAVARQDKRIAAMNLPAPEPGADRGWTREELHERGKSR